MNEKEIGGRGEARPTGVLHVKNSWEEKVTSVVKPLALPLTAMLHKRACSFLPAGVHATCRQTNRYTETGIPKQSLPSTLSQCLWGSSPLLPISFSLSPCPHLWSSPLLTWPGDVSVSRMLVEAAAASVAYPRDTARTPARMAIRTAIISSVNAKGGSGARGSACCGRVREGSWFWCMRALAGPKRKSIQR